MAWDPMRLRYEETEDEFSHSYDFYAEQYREEQLENDGINNVEEAVMKGWDEAKAYTDIEDEY
jgi:hypothetical protein